MRRELVGHWCDVSTEDQIEWDVLDDLPWMLIEPVSYVQDDTLDCDP